VQVKIKLRPVLIAIAATVLVTAWALCAIAADDLKLAPDLSFTDDSSSNFPIMSDHSADSALAPSEATILFFGTAHCWNTNREAERLVALYPKYRGKIHFVIIDLNNVADNQKQLVAKYYRGAIPTIAVIDSNGHVIYDRAGETASSRGDASNLESLLNSAH
jgi:Tfp pilus assembly ATPase PilU